MLTQSSAANSGPHWHIAGTKILAVLVTKESFSPDILSCIFPKYLREEGEKETAASRLYMSLEGGGENQGYIYEKEWFELSLDPLAGFFT